MLVVDGGVEAEFVGEPGTFFISSGDAYDSTAVNLADLPGDASRCASGSGDHQRLAFLRLGDFGHAEIGGQAGHAEDAEKERVGDERDRRDFLEGKFRLPFDNYVFLKTRKANDFVSLFE